MEKRRPHYSLARVQALVGEGQFRITESALTGAAVLGLSLVEIVDVVRQLAPRDFYKCMTSYADYRVWQDVYLPKTIAGLVYVKLTVIEDVVILSFKRR